MKKEQDFVVYKSWFSRKVGIINKCLGNNMYLVDEYFWHDDDNKIKHGKIIKGKDILN